MTNFASVNKKNKIITPENSVLFIPIFIGLIILITLLGLVFRPLVNKLSVEESQIELLEEKISYIPKYKKLVNDISLYSSRARKQQLRLLQLISDKNELKTILSELNKIYSNNNLELVTIVPQQIVSFNESNNKIDDPFLISSIEKHSFEVTLRGAYNSLIDFLKELELLQTIVIIDQIKIVKSNSQSTELINLEMSFNLTTYAKLSNKKLDTNQIK
tara:strand:+ start:2852 stop:3502 length:651 start_codon:yes stop_codon:yes gene_type:complete